MTIEKRYGILYLSKTMAGVIWKEKIKRVEIAENISPITRRDIVALTNKTLDNANEINQPLISTTYAHFGKVNHIFGIKKKRLFIP